MALQHLRSGTANKRPNPAAMSDGQVALNTAATSPGLFFKDSAGDLVKVGPVHVGTTAPNVSPASGGTAGNSKGEQWLDTSGANPVLKIWDGSAWQSQAGEFVNASGDTMTGALVMDNQQQIRFRETTANGTNFIAIQAPTSVDTDKTLTLPNATGTLVSTGDTGTVTSTMIADGTIVNADVNASAAIAGTKISPDFGSQNRTSTGTSTAASFIPTSSTVPTNGVYLPAANSVAISTAGSGRLFVDASGNIFQGGTQTGFQAGPSGSISKYISIQSQDATTTQGVWLLNQDATLRRRSAFAIDPANNVAGLYTASSSGSAPDLVFAPANTERLRITSAGLVGIGVSSPGAVIHTYAAVGGGNPSTSGTTDANVAARFQAGSVNLDVGVQTAGHIWLQPRLVSDFSSNFNLLLCPNGGRVGVGTTSPQQLLHVNSSGSNGGQLQITNASTGAASTDGLLVGYNTSNDVIFNNQEATQTKFFTSGLERVAIDASGRLLVGTATSIPGQFTGESKFQVAGTGIYNISAYQYSNNTFDSYMLLGKSRGGSVGSHAIVQSGDGLGAIRFEGSDGTGFVAAALISAQVDGTPGLNDMPGRLVFSTTGDGGSFPTERMRIASTGELTFPATSSGYTLNATSSATTWKFGPTAGAGPFYVVNSGNTGVQLNNNATSWSTSSDERLKENLQPIPDGLNKVSSLRACTGKYITDEPGTSRSFLIAQDVQAVLPEAVDTEDPDNLALRYTEVIPLLVAALKESKERIETLEAKVAALELS